MWRRGMSLAASGECRSLYRMAYNLVKLVGVFVLAALVLVLLALDRLDATQGFAVLGLLIGYVIGNASVVNISPIVRKD